MLELDQLKQQLGSFTEPLAQMKASLDLENKGHRIQELEREMEAPDFWNDAALSTQKTKELKSLKDDVAVYHSLEELFSDIEAYIELGNEEEDPEIAAEAIEAFEEFKSTFESIRMKTLLSGEYDEESAIVTLHSGAGGTEACDWVSMLFGGQSGMGFLWKCWTISMGMRPGSNP